MQTILADWRIWAWSLGTIAVAGLAALLAHKLLYSTALRFTTRTKNGVDESLVRHSFKPARWILPILAILAVTPTLPLAPAFLSPFRHVLVLLLIAAIAWLMVALLRVIEDLLAARYRIDVSNNLTARRIRTQVQVLRRVAVIVIGVVSLAAMLMTFPLIWNIGAGLFASAGATGLIIGMAARSTLSNLLAGMQIALTEPIRLEDVVIVEGEWGWIEEIGTTYVVVRIWDLRRLVVPLSYFIEKPFQNWTRHSQEILGTVFVYVDYSVPIEEVRGELHSILKSTPLWDGKVWSLQVTNTSDRAVELRALMSASDSGRAWDLRCVVREKLIAFLQERYPHSLPRVRTDIQRLPSGGEMPGGHSVNASA